MSYCIIDSTGAANDFATSQGIVDLEAIAGPNLTSFLDTGEADESLAKEIVTEVKDDDATAYIADLFSGTAPFILSNGIEEDDQEKGEKYSDDQPRDESGRWTDAGGGGSTEGGDTGVSNESAVSGLANSASAGDIASAVAKNAKAAEPTVTSAIKALADAHGGDLKGLDLNLKSKDSIERKLEKEAEDRRLSLKEAASQRINDALRYTSVFSNDDFSQGSQSMLDGLRAQGYHVDSVRSTWDSDQYRGTNTNIVTPGGLKFELQFHTTESWALKQNQSHALYEKLRTATTASDRDHYEKEIAKLWTGVTAPKGWSGVKHDQVLQVR